MSQQLPINFDAAQIAGHDFDPVRDRDRLTGQLKQLYNLMSNGAWYELNDISRATGIPHASASAQIRNLRKQPFFFTIEREYVSNGLYRYRLIK